MKQIIIENPVINSPYREPERHFKFDNDGITNEIMEFRRISSYFMPIPASKKKSKQMEFETEWTKDRIEENKFINQIRERVAQWQKGRHIGITKTTARLLEYWTNPEREKKLFFCQIEALKTAIYLAEVANKYGDKWIENQIRQANEDANPKLYRIAFKMATGSGKTVVMAMLIAWQALNKFANSQDEKYSDAFLIVTPGITIRDRLRVLLPNDPQNYYKQRDIIPPDLTAQFHKVKIIITNYHAFLLRETVKAAKTTKEILNKDKNNIFTETPAQMVNRVCRELGNKKNITVINDESHHCYRHRVGGEEIQLIGDERKEAQKREEAARVWISGLEAVKKKIGIKVVYDLSATPFFLRGSGYPEGTLFPWVVSDFSLIDAIESGIVKVPRVPVADDSVIGEQPTYRDLWIRIKEHLPKKGRGKEKITGKPVIPVELEGALKSLYGNYKQYYELWNKNQHNGITPPVFIVVCNNTNVSKLVFDYIAGWEKELADGTLIAVPGELEIFSNVKDGIWLDRPNTILIDSEQLESGDAMSDEFKKIAQREIEEFKNEYRIRFEGRDIEKITDEDLLREVMNTVGKPGKLGEQIKCVVSVSMLTEGWDANTVSHILGVRAFGTQLLCEQVVGRGLRRRNYIANDNEIFEPEYAEVYGVPFSFIPCSGSKKEPKPGPIPTRVRALENRIACEITFPRLMGYRYELPPDKLEHRFTNDSKFVLSTADIPTKTENAPIVGEKSIHTLDELKQRREQEIAFLLSKLVLEKYFRQDGENKTDITYAHQFESEVQAWLFPQVLNITKHWLQQCIQLKDNTFIQMLLLLQFANNAADKIYQSILKGTDGDKRLKPIFQPYNTIGSTQYVDFDTTKPVYITREDKCHISHVVCDTRDWEQKLAQSLEEMDEIICYVKNHNLGFTIPYILNGEEHNYIPDFIVKIKNKDNDIIHLILEVTGEPKKDKPIKVATANNLWIPAVNNHAEFGQWAFWEIKDPWNTKNIIRGFIDKLK